MESCRHGEPTSCQEYLQTDWTGHANNPNLRYKYVLCSQEEARTITERGYFEIPIVILAAPNVLLTDMDDFLGYLSTKPLIDVHIYDGRKSNDKNDKEETDYRLPYSLPSAEAIELFRSEKDGPVNFLNLGLWEDNAVSPCMLGLRNWSILRDTRDKNQSGKRAYRQPDDLSSCTGFEICASEYAWSMPHRDRHGTTTSARVRNKNGKKYWPTWPELTRDEELAWAEDGGPAPPGVQPMGLFLPEAAQILLPGSRVHAPYTMRKTHMTGGVYWHSTALARVIRQSMDEIRWTHMTNEFPANDIGIKLNIIKLQIMKDEREHYYDFGPPSERTKVLNLIEVRSPASSAPNTADG